MDFTPVMCPPSLTELCRYLFIKEIVRFPAGSGRLLFTAAEQQPKNGTAQRAAVQHLPAQGHGHVAAPGVHPGAEARLLEQQRCHQAHHRAHDADDHQRDGIGDELRPVGGLHESESQRGFSQEGSKVGQSAQKRRSADRFCYILPFVFKISTKVCLFLCIVCEWTNDAPACIIKPETREVQQKLK